MAHSLREEMNIHSLFSELVNVAGIMKEEHTPSSQQWQPIPEKMFLENLPPGLYLLQDSNNLCKRFTLDEVDEQLKSASPNQCYCSEGICKSLHECSLIDHAIRANIEAYNHTLENVDKYHLQGMDCHKDPLLLYRLQRMNTFVHMRFGAFRPVHAGKDALATFISPDQNFTAAAEGMELEIMDSSSTEVIKTTPIEIDTAVSQSANQSYRNCDFLKIQTGPVGQDCLAVSDPPVKELTDVTGPSENTVIATSNKSGDQLLKKCSVYVRRLEDELPKEKIDSLWRKMRRAVNRR